MVKAQLVAVLCSLSLAPASSSTCGVCDGGDGDGELGNCGDGDCQKGEGDGAAGGVKKVCGA